jgi:hypothetical protein
MPRAIIALRVSIWQVLEIFGSLLSVLTFRETPRDVWSVSISQDDPLPHAKFGALSQLCAKNA